MEELHVGLESIQFQFKDTNFINELENEFTSLQKIYNNKKLNTSQQFMKNSLVKSSIINIEEILLKRYGINFRHQPSEEVTYGVIPVEPKSVNVLSGDVKAKIDKMRSQLIAGNPIDNETEIRKTVLASYNAIHKTLNVSGVIVDESLAKIVGLPSDYKLVLFANFPLMFSIGISPLEVVAFLLHEVGHAFTHISEAYRTVQLTGAFVDALKEGDVPIDKRFRIINKKIIGVNATGGSPETVLINFHAEALRMVKPLNPHDTQHYVEPERLADEFAIRFGLGKELGVGIAKVNAVVRNNPKMFLGRRLKSDYSIQNITTLLYGLTMAVIGLFSMLKLNNFIILIITSLLSYIMYRAILGTEKNTVKTYDKPKERLSRIIRGEVNVLRTFPKDIPDFYRDMQVEKIELLRQIFKETPNDNTFGDNLIEKLPWFSSKTNDTNTQRSLEILTENILHSQSHRFKTASDNYVHS